MHPDIIILAGGRGTRFGPSVQQYGCKSLIPIDGLPALEWLLRAVTFAFIDQCRVFLCVNREELLPKIERIAQRAGGKRIETFFNPQLRGSMHALYLLQHTLKSKHIFVLYGHQPIPPQHLMKMVCRGESDAIATLYPTNSNVLRMIGAMDPAGRILRLWDDNDGKCLGPNEYYVDVPYLVPMSFVQAQPEEYVKSHEAMRQWLIAGNMVQGVIARFPHEFHYPEELPSLVRFAKRNRKELGVRTA